MNEDQDQETIVAIPCAWGPTAAPGSVIDHCQRCNIQVWTDIYSQRLRQLGVGLVCVPCAMALLATANPDEIHEACPSWAGWARRRSQN